ncbi:IS630 family transposase [Methylobacterium sp. Leaf112]|uniref:IS630 family transposase n=1 Tax=Methylobacterium sp. Leaf112 TaxID=1736258 RepID=UPI0012E96C44|nr:IS630 family transposase [Methylobacterium sp. Leaf112]
MPSGLSADLRERVVVAIEAGASRREAARRFKVSLASAVRRYEAFVREGRTWAKPMGSDQHSHLSEAQADLIRQTDEARPELFLHELRAQLAEYGLKVGVSRLSRFFKRHGITRKKNTRHAAEQDREDVKAARLAWFERQPDLDPGRLVFLDETATNTKMARRYGWAPRSERCRVVVPFGHWKTITVTAGLRASGLTATALFHGPMTGIRFRRYVEETLVPTLKQGDAVVLDNLPAHKVSGIRERIEAAGARLLYLPAYSPDFNPIELASAKLKVRLRAQGARTLVDDYDTLKQAFGRFTPNECRNHLVAAGYETFDPI